MLASSNDLERSLEVMFDIDKVIPQGQAAVIWPSAKLWGLNWSKRGLKETLTIMDLNLSIEVITR